MHDPSDKPPVNPSIRAELHYRAGPLHVGFNCAGGPRKSDIDRNAAVLARIEREAARLTAESN